MPAGANTGRARQDAGREWEYTECRLVVGSLCGVPWGSRARSRLFNSKQNQQGLASSSEILHPGHTN